MELPAYQKNQTEILDALQEKDKAVSLTLQTCAASLQNILEDIYIEARMCAAFPGSFRKGIQLNNLRMLEQIPDLHEQLSRDYQPFTIATNLLLAYCRSGTISNRFHSDSEYLDVLADGMEYIDHGAGSTIDQRTADCDKLPACPVLGLYQTAGRRNAGEAGTQG